MFRILKKILGIFQQPMTENEPKFQKSIDNKIIYEDIIPHDQIINNNTLKPHVLEPTTQDQEQSRTSNKPVVDKLQNFNTTSLDLIIGLDLGTSTCKVVVQAPDLTNSPAWVVNFGELGYGEDQYLLPTEVYFNSKTKSFGIKKDEESISYKHIKTGLFNDEVYHKKNENLQKEFKNISNEIFAASYMALILKYIRENILSNQERLLSKYKIIWNLNLGIPSPTLDDFVEKDRFMKIARVGWNLSLDNTNQLTLKQVKEELKRYDKPKRESKPNVDCEITLIPEIIAGSYGYALSPQRRNGLHIIVDIGASTVDVCGFRLARHTETLENVSALLVADVQPLGTFRIHMLNGNDDYLQPLKYDESKQEDYHEIAHKFNVLIKGTINNIRNHRDTLADEFKKDHKLPFIVIGGGSNSSLYNKWIEGIDNWIRNKHIKNSGLEFIEVPLPDTIKRARGKYLTVAWGLSHRDLDIGLLIPPSEIEDTPKPFNRESESLFVSKDQV